MLNNVSLIKDEQDKLAAIGASLIQMSRLVKLSRPEIFTSDLFPDCTGDELCSSWTRCKLSWNSMRNLDVTIDKCFEVPLSMKFSS